MITKALYVGSFDPITRGHLDIVNRALHTFDEVTIGIGTNPAKRYTFDEAERLQLIHESIAELGPSKLATARLTIAQVRGLAIDHAKIHGFTHLIKGARTAQDFDYEKLLHEISLTQQQGIDTVLLFADTKLAHVSSTAVKELARYQGITTGMVPHCVRRALAHKNGQFIIGVTGTIGSGKSTFCKAAVALHSQHGVPAHHLNLDEVAHELTIGTSALSQHVAHQVEQQFGTTDRKQLGQIVFGNKDALEKLAQITHEPILTLLRQKLTSLQGIVYLEGALLPEFGWAWLSTSGHAIHLKSPAPSEHQRRLESRGLTADQIKKRVASQWDDHTKLVALNHALDQHEITHLHEYSSSDPIEPLVEQIEQEWGHTPQIR